ncbi:MAG: DUF2510 domain-containing protein [Thermoleophilia bacterium]
MDYAPSPGWHTDPTGRHQHRWWDGSRWTAQVADSGTVTTDLVPVTAPPPVKVPPPLSSPHVGHVGYGPQNTIAAGEKHGNSTAVFVLGLLGLLLCGVLAPIAWIMGTNARRDIENGGGRYTGDGLLTAGWIMGIIGTIYMGVVLVVVIAVVLAA